MLFDNLRESAILVVIKLSVVGQLVDKLRSLALQASEFCFMKKGSKMTDESRKKLSDSKKGLVPWNKGKVGVQNHSYDTRKKMSESHKKIGAPWMIGKKLSDETKKKLSEANKKNGNRPPIKKGTEHPSWKGELAGYSVKHQWMRKMFGTPLACEKCGCSGESGRGRYEWANISGKYIRERKDWIRLCRMCHEEFDHPKKTV